MLNFLRQHPLRKSLWLIVLLGSLLTQTQSLFACELLNNGSQAVCCCDEDMDKGCSMGGGCVTNTLDGVTLSGCCDVSTNIDVGLQDVVVADAHHSKQIRSLEAPQPPPIILTCIELFIPFSNALHPLYAHVLSLALSSPGTQIYISTNRVRI